MKMKSIHVMLMTALMAFSVVAAWPQATLSRVSGKVMDAGKPIAGAQIVFTNLDNGKVYKGKTDKNGTYIMVGLERTGFQIDVTSATGEKLYTVKERVTGEMNGEMGGEQQLDFDISKGNAKGPSKEQIEAIKQQNAKAESQNALIGQAMAALNAKNYEGAIPILQQLTQGDPNRWQFFQALGNAQYQTAKYEDSIQSLDKGIQVAQNVVAGNIKDPKNPDTDPVKAKAGLAQMLQTQGNAYLKLHKNPEAIAAFEKAANMDTNTGNAYFNICATQYNTGNMDGAEAACDKAIAADPNKAEAYFIKGSAMFGKGKMDANNKWSVPPGTTEALNKYLQLAPDGSHANDVKQMLESVGAKIETTYKAKKK